VAGVSKGEGGHSVFVATLRDACLRQGEDMLLRACDFFRTGPVLLVESRWVS